MIFCQHLSHPQNFHTRSVGIKDDIFDVGYGNLISIKLHVHFPFAVLERKEVTAG